METIIGFVVGFIVGTREGKEGLDRLRTSWHSIRTSPEVRRLAREATTVAESVARQAAKGGLGGTVGSVTDMLIRKAAGSDGRPSDGRPQAQRVA
ncbi:MAG TPA: hypothetical protein VLW50_19475 [Streptosporangiaceae bacterium]|nr:hypothetical protein [Streptosporangiaceae bacterium]